MPESPRFLLERGDKIEAQQILKRIRASSDVSEEISAIEQDLNNQKSYSATALFLTSSGRHALMIGCGLQLIQQLIGINTAWD